MCFFIADDLDAGLKVLKAQHGTPEAETIRRALSAYLSEKGVLAEKTAKARKSVKRR
jgi:hypothetical protein